MQPPPCRCNSSLASQALHLRPAQRYWRVRGAGAAPVGQQHTKAPPTPPPASSPMNASAPVCTPASASEMLRQKGNRMFKSVATLSPSLHLQRLHEVKQLYTRSVILIPLRVSEHCFLGAAHQFPAQAPACTVTKLGMHSTLCIPHHTASECLRSEARPAWQRLTEGSWSSRAGSLPQEPGSLPHVLCTRRRRRALQTGRGALLNLTGSRTLVYCCRLPLCSYLASDTAHYFTVTLAAS